MHTNRPVKNNYKIDSLFYFFYIYITNEFVVLLLLNLIKLYICILYI